MRTLVTGASGFVGNHVARAIAERGEPLRLLVRPQSPREGLRGIDAEIVEGDLRDPRSLRSAVEGCDRLFHVAAAYVLGARDQRELYAANVEGTRNVLQAAADAGVRRVVYTSTVGALATSTDGTPANEQTPVSLGDVVGPYKRSKFLAQRVALEFFAKGLPVVIVNPTAPVGPGDRKPTPTGRMIVDFLRGRMPGWVDTGLNLVAVEDVAQGHLLAAEKGRPGELYVLGHRNLHLREILGMLARITGRRPPRWRLPHWVATAAALASETSARFRGGTATISLESVRLSRHFMYFDSAKAVRELGLPQSPVEDALERAVAWFRDHEGRP